MGDPEFTKAASRLAHTTKPLPIEEIAPKGEEK
jgi:hypothetical protein